MRLRLALAAAALLPAAVRAQTTLTFASSLNNPIAGNYYVGPYSATLAPTVGQATGISIICVDFLNEVTFGQRFAVNVESVGPSWSRLPLSRHPGQIDVYRQAAWLGTQFAAAPRTQWGSIQYAIWNLFTPSQAPDDAQSPMLANLATVASSHDYGAFDYGGVHYGAVDMSRWSLLTDVAAAGQATGGAQEFLTNDSLPVAAVPEPATFALVGSGLGGIAIYVRRRRRRIAAEAQLD